MKITRAGSAPSNKGPEDWFTGTVRVETLHNDFDFRNDRFSGDFLWHECLVTVRDSHRNFSETGNRLLLSRNWITF